MLDHISRLAVLDIQDLLKSLAKGEQFFDTLIESFGDQLNTKVAKMLTGLVMILQKFLWDRESDYMSIFYLYSPAIYHRTGYFQEQQCYTIFI